MNFTDTNLVVTNFVEMKKRLAKILLERSYKEGDFLLASGRRSDYYFDCRVTSLSAEGSWLIGNLFNQLLKDLDICGVGGMSMGADPLVSATTVISHTVNRPLHGLLVRKEAKDHGRGNLVEGMENFPKGAKIAVLEDVITSGKSVLLACTRLKDAGFKLVKICAILDREEGGKEALLASGYEFEALFTRKELLDLGKE